MNLFQSLKKPTPTSDDVEITVNGVTFKGPPDLVRDMAAKIASTTPAKLPVAPPTASPKPTLVPEAPKAVEEPEIMGLDAFVLVAQKKGMAAAFREVMTKELQFDPQVMRKQIETAHQFASRSLMTQFRSGLEAEGVDVTNPEISRALMEVIDSKYGAEILPSVMAKAVAGGREAGWIPALEKKPEKPEKPEEPKLMPSLFPDTEGEIESNFEDADVQSLSAQIDAQVLAAEKEGGEPAAVALLQSLGSEIRSGEE